MVVCKFFQEGNCKKGSKCKFEHCLVSTTNRKDRKIDSMQEKPLDRENIDSVKEKPLFPGFEDKSFEEIRFAYYEAAKNGTLKRFTQDFQSMLEDALMKVKKIQNPNERTVEMIGQIFKGSVLEVPATVLGKRTHNTAFGETAPALTPGIRAQAPNFQFEQTYDTGSVFTGARPTFQEQRTFEGRGDSNKTSFFNNQPQTSGIFSEQQALTTNVSGNKANDFGSQKHAEDNQDHALLALVKELQNSVGQLLNELKEQRADYCEMKAAYNHFKDFSEDFKTMKTELSILKTRNNPNNNNNSEAAKLDVINRITEGENRESNTLLNLPEPVSEEAGIDVLVADRLQLKQTIADVQSEN